MAVTYYNKKDLVKFGTYLLSDKRKELILATPSELSDEERLSKVYDSDLDKFLERKK